MTSREKFEAWYLDNWGHTEDDHETMFERDPDSDEEYCRLGVRMAWESWQTASKASEQQLEESRREFRAADATIHNLELQLTDMAVQLANAESKCRELAAELSAVDKIHNEAAFITDDHYEQCPPEVQKMIRSLAVLQIPSCDAFLAEVRASELDSLAGVAETMLVKFSNQRCSQDMHEVVGWKMVLQQASNRAAKLRKGAVL